MQTRKEANTDGPTQYMYTHPNFRVQKILLKTGKWNNNSTRCEDMMQQK